MSNKPVFVIRKASESDFTEIFAMISELAEFEKATHKLTNSVAQMLEEKHYFECIVAETVTGEIAGMALYYFAYYTWVGKSLYLDDLYVKPQFRGLGLGTQLITDVVAIAQKEHCKRMRWQVLEWNQSAINLYRKLGANIDAEWLNCDLSANEINKFAVSTEK
ncbi:MAG TPA: GNAT family N-acetyltransferase [Bacteroidales bacterium]|nr:GNAT family N-acetyltransferase [Bacteroidales bacterium]